MFGADESGDLRALGWLSTVSLSFSALDEDGRRALQTRPITNNTKTQKTKILSVSSSSSDESDSSEDVASKKSRKKVMKKRATSGVKIPGSAPTAGKRRRSSSTDNNTSKRLVTPKSDNTKSKKTKKSITAGTTTARKAKSNNNTVDVVDLDMLENNSMFTLMSPMLADDLVGGCIGEFESETTASDIMDMSNDDVFGSDDSNWMPTSYVPEVLHPSMSMGVADDWGFPLMLAGM